jgi:microsomal dipeptidase-like Zn-dependent dipeptidase
VRRAALALVLLAAWPAGARARAVDSTIPLARGCFTLASASGHRTLGKPFDLKPTGLGTYLLEDTRGRLLRVDGGRVRRTGTPATAGPRDEWRIARVARRTFTVRSTRDRRSAAPWARFRLLTAKGCRRFPEAGLDAGGRTFSGRTASGRVLGVAETHLHITANLRAGGRVISGEPFDRFGVIRALGRDAAVHGADGSRDVTGNLLRDGVPFGTHDVHGWPTFAGWPVTNTNTHQQIYYRWLQRAYLGGLRLVVAQTVEDDELCRIEPRRSHSCSEPATIALEARTLRALQDYVDAQAGGRGRGWFRLVDGPRQARRVIARGKLAVVIGVESSNPFGCELRPGRRHCTRADVDRGVARYRRLGVRGLFIAHWFDNAFAGAALEGGVKGKFINAMNRLETGHWFAAARCPAAGQGEEPQAPQRFEIQVLQSDFPAVKPLLKVKLPSYPKAKRCNARGLTPLGRHLVRRLMAAHMLIEADHMSERARDAVLAIAAERHYPVVSSHNGTGGAWSAAELRRLYRLGGFASVTSGTAPELAAKVVGQERYRTRRFAFGPGIGTDTGGFASLPEPRADATAHPLRYPFRAIRGRVVFGRERSGSRTFDLNTDGVAHYGLLADLLADMRGKRHGAGALRDLLGSAEAYLEMWSRTGARG